MLILFLTREINILGEKIERAPLSRIKIDKSKPVNTILVGMPSGIK